MKNSDPLQDEESQEPIEKVGADSADDSSWKYKLSHIGTV